jgi:hypothetical protein
MNAVIYGFGNVYVVREGAAESRRGGKTAERTT